MSAEAIARVVADLRAGRQKPLLMLDPVGESGRKLQDYADEAAAFDGPIVDATAIYDSLIARDDPVALYEDHPCIAPPWDSAAVCYENEHGNVIAITFLAPTMDGHRNWSAEQVVADLETGRQGGTQPALWEPAEPVDWDRVKWVITALAWIGGRSAAGPVKTGGPVHMWKFAVYENGEPADLHWVQLLPQFPREFWDNAHLVLLGALNFCNCRNVELVEPQRPRPEARRIARTGMQVHEINVFPTGKSVRSAAGERQGGTPLTSVRGHFACYGPEYDRGLLFGRHSGRFWIPQHARGEAALGENQHDYRLVAQ